MRSFKQGCIWRGGASGGFERPQEVADPPQKVL